MSSDITDTVSDERFRGLGKLKQSPNDLQYESSVLPAPADCPESHQTHQTVIIFELRILVSLSLHRPVELELTPAGLDLNPARDA